MSGTTRTPALRHPNSGASPPTKAGRPTVQAQMAALDTLAERTADLGDLLDTANMQYRMLQAEILPKEREHEEREVKRRKKEVDWPEELDCGICFSIL